MFDPHVVELILAGIAGLTVVGVTEMLKRMFKTGGIWGYLISLAASAAFTAFYLAQAGIFTLIAFIGYTLFVFLAANGIYKAVAKT